MARAALATSNPRAAFFPHPFICPAIPQKTSSPPATIAHLYPRKTRNTLIWNYLAESKGAFLYSGNAYRGNLFEMYAFAMESTIRDILAKYPDLVDRIADGTASQKYPGLRKEIRQIFLKHLQKEYQQRDQPRRWPGLPGGAGTPCFTGGTAVHTEAGLRGIETISVGTRVWAYDQERQCWCLAHVLDTEAHDYVGAMVTIKGGKDVIEATETHPFWVVSGESLTTRPSSRTREAANGSSPESGQWVAARDLQCGDVLLARDGVLLTVASTQIKETGGRVYNLRVGRLNNYAVGNVGLLVNSM